MTTRFIIKDFKIVSTMVYNFETNTNTDCTICRCNLNSNSIYNQDKGLDSKISSGICGHVFHEECIMPWINISKNKNCPICSKEWKFNYKY